MPKKISKKFYLFAFIAVLILAFTVGFLFNRVKNANTGNQKAQVDEDQQDGQATVAPEAPTATFAPLAETVKSIEEDKIIVSNNNGEMIIPKNSDMVKVFAYVNGKLEESSFDAVRVGQRVTLKIIIPGQKAELILEE